MNAQSRIQRLLEDVLRQPGNDKCADCHASSPRWASTNLGIFLCVQCASMHRRLGTHTSRVKSVTLDEWTREQVTHMRAVGNTRSNALYNPDERRHPPPLQAAEERDSELFKYIRRKYELGAFKAGAAPALAQKPVNSRVIAQQARSASGSSYQSTASSGYPGSVRSQHTGSTSAGAASPATPTFGAAFAPKRPELADIVVNRDRDLPALPSPPPKGLAPPPTRARAPTWSGELAPPRPTPVRSSSANALRQQDLLVDTAGSSSATRPLQVNTLGGFPAVPYASGPFTSSPGGMNAGMHGMGGMGMQPPNATPGFAPLNSPYPAPSPLALGQQAFHFPPFQQQQQQQFAGNNPFGAQYAGNGMLAPGGMGASPGVSPMHTGMSGGMAASPMMGHAMPSGMSNGMPNGMGQMNGMSNGGMSQMNGMGQMNGMPNGMTGGMSNGGMAQMNGMGQMNGMSNGMSGGMSNGMGMNGQMSNGQMGQMGMGGMGYGYGAGGGYM